jgi:hypothetical protein
MRAEVLGFLIDWWRGGRYKVFSANGIILEIGKHVDVCYE